MTATVPMKGAKKALEKFHDENIQWCNCYSKLSWHKKGTVRCRFPDHKVLTSKHQMMLYYLAEGDIVPVAAKKAGLSDGKGARNGKSTYERAMQVILYSLGAKSIAHAIAIAFRRNLIQ